MKNFISKLHTYIVRYPIATFLTILVVIGSVFLMVTGRSIQIGGLLGKIWRKKSDITPDVRIIPPPERKENGKTIEPGVSDSSGFVQVSVQIPIEKPGFLSDPNTIVVNHPSRGREVIQLPIGVRNEDVNQIVEIKPKIYQISNDDSGVNAYSILNDIDGVK